MSEQPQIQGFCPVAYFAVGEALEGNKEFSATHNDKLYYFVSEEARQEFEKNPDKYIPAYGGNCAFGMSIEKEFKVCPRNFKIINDKLYLFLHNEDTDALALWNEEDEAKCLVNADKHWASMQTS